MSAVLQAASIPSIDKLSEQIVSGALRSEDLMRAYLDRIAEREATIGAWEWLDPDRALAAARAADAARPLSPLHGVPVGIKDVIDTADMPTAYGSPIYAGHQPPWDAACVALLRRAGAVVMGKTVTTEFAAIHPGKTRNPRDPSRTPGGSSSGSAAAVADGMVWAALGTQTAGSTIRPASFCGVVGYKPTYGTISRTGMKPLAESLDTIGAFARTPRDAGWLVAAMSDRPELRIDGEIPDRPRLALCRTPHWDQASPAAQNVLAEAAWRLTAAGASMTERELPRECDGLTEAAMTILLRDARQGFAHELRTAPDQVSQALRDLLSRDLEGDPRPYDEAQALAARCRLLVEQEVFGDFDAILTLSAADEAPVGLSSTGALVFNHLWTLLHVPCVNVPGLLGLSGVPIGVQLIGPRRGDANLLRIAQWAQEVLAG